MSIPIYSAPVDLGFDNDLIKKAKVVAHLGSHYDETAHLTNWHIPSAHYLESWSDARAYDGTVSIVQPMIEPLYGGKSAHDVFQTLLDDPQLSAYEAVRITQKDNIKGDFETGWRKVLHAGWIENTAFRQRTALDTVLPAASVRRFQHQTQKINSKLSSVPTPTSMTGAIPTSAGSRNSPSPSRASAGITRQSFPVRRLKV